MPSIHHSRSKVQDLKFNIVHQNSSIIALRSLEVLAQEKSERLEKIIIALISIEIALGVWGHVEGGKMGWVAEALGALGWDVFGFKGPGGGGGK